MAGTWTVDPTTLNSLRQREAQRALVEGRLDDALIEAEELLDEQPTHPYGLAIVGLSALRMGDTVMALEALNRFIELHEPDATIMHALTVARFEAVDYRGALSAAEQATKLDPSLVASWHYQGLTLERMGKRSEAYERFERAAALDAEQFPIPKDHSDLAWEPLLERALASLPKDIQSFYSSVDIRFGDFPAVEDLLEHYPPLSPFTDALYRGRPPQDEDPWSHRPTQLTLYKANLVRPSIVEEDVVKRMSDALVHEAMHWLGVSEIPG